MNYLNYPNKFKEGTINKKKLYRKLLSSMIRLKKPFIIKRMFILYEPQSWSLRFCKIPSHCVYQSAFIRGAKDFLQTNEEINSGKMATARTKRF